MNYKRTTKIVLDMAEDMALLNNEKVNKDNIIGAVYQIFKQNTLKIDKRFKLNSEEQFAVTLITAYKALKDGYLSLSSDAFELIIYWTLKVKSSNNVLILMRQGLENYPFEILEGMLRGLMHYDYDHKSIEGKKLLLRALNGRELVPLQKEAKKRSLIYKIQGRLKEWWKIPLAFAFAIVLFKIMVALKKFF